VRLERQRTCAFLVGVAANGGDVIALGFTPSLLNSPSRSVKDRCSVNRKADTTGRGTALAFLAIVITFGGLAWNLEVVGGWALPLVDLGLLALLLLVTLALQRVLLGGRHWGLLRWWAVGGVLLLALDAAVAPAVPDDPLTIFGSLLARVVACAIPFRRDCRSESMAGADSQRSRDRSCWVEAVSSGGSAADWYVCRVCRGFSLVRAQRERGQKCR
jgi:hypothetical protein